MTKTEQSGTPRTDLVWREVKTPKITDHCYIESCKLERDLTAAKRRIAELEAAHAASDEEVDRLVEQQQLWQRDFDSLAAENEALRRALEKTAQRLNESATGEMGLLETIHQAHGIVRTALSTPAADHLKAHDAQAARDGRHLKAAAIRARKP